jgi:hypothetical protein
MRWSPPLLIGVAMRQDREGEISYQKRVGGDHD